LIQQFHMKRPHGAPCRKQAEITRPLSPAHMGAPLGFPLCAGDIRAVDALNGKERRF
jgi:hypothetical protein